MCTTSFTCLHWWLLRPITVHTHKAHLHKLSCCQRLCHSYHLKSTRFKSKWLLVALLLLSHKRLFKTLRASALRENVNVRYTEHRLWGNHSDLGGPSSRWRRERRALYFPWLISAPSSPFISCSPTASIWQTQTSITILISCLKIAAFGSSWRFLSVLTCFFCSLKPFNKLG